MSIHGVNISNQGIDRSQAAQATERVRSAEKSTEGKLSPVADSTLSSQTKEMDRLASSVEDSRAERLNEVRQALESGTYRVAATDLAKKLIDSNRK